MKLPSNKSSTMAINMCTAVAPVNIAVIKYWGKKDETLIIPVNDSLSVTLSKNEMCAKTTVAYSEQFEEDRLWLNGKEQDITAPRIKACISEIKKRAGDQRVIHQHLHICSENNFPTAAGLASSAAGFACLVKALSSLYNVEGDLSKIARQGSGSACRSMYGGFVHWFAGKDEDGNDSIAQQIAPKEHWPEFRAIILVVNAGAKDVSSTKGMQQSVITSSLLQYRLSNIVPSRVEDIKRAILLKDFQSFAEITMKESNQFHAICLDTFPPIHYLNSTSYKIIHLVHAYNEFYGENRVAYTFDAGPNACLYLLEKDVQEMLALIKSVFPPTNENTEYIKGSKLPMGTVSQTLQDSIQVTPNPGGIQYIINSQVGSGPKIVEPSNQHLLNDKGFPLTNS